MNKTHEPEDEFDNELNQKFYRSIEQTAKAIEERDNLDYDGVVGFPPEWVPEWAISFFQNYRSRLLDVRGYTYDDLVELVERYMDVFFRTKYTRGVETSNFPYPAVYPNGRSIDFHCFMDEIGFLAWLKWCVDQGKEIGLIELSGKNGLLGFQRRQNLAGFGQERAKAIQQERIPEWEKWVKEKNRLIKINPHLAKNKSGLAKKIKKNLKLTESINTIRQRI